jgi:Ras family protein
VLRANPSLYLTQDEYSILNSKHAIGIHGFVLVYSVTSRKSFEMVQIVYDKIVNFCGMSSIPCVIVGAKNDLAQRYNTTPQPVVAFDFQFMFL